MALTSYMHDEEVICIDGALQYSCYTGYASSFCFDGDYDNRRKAETPPTVCAMDALQGCAKIQFKEGLVMRDLNKARLAFDGVKFSCATGNWGCGAFGNDHMLKFIQQWMAASDAGAKEMHYHVFGDKRSGTGFFAYTKFKTWNVGQLYCCLMEVIKECETKGPNAKAHFHKRMEDKGREVSK